MGWPLSSVGGWGVGGGRGVFEGVCSGVWGEVWWGGGCKSRDVGVEAVG